MEVGIHTCLLSSRVEKRHEMRYVGFAQIFDPVDDVRSDSKSDSVVVRFTHSTKSGHIVLLEHELWGVLIWISVRGTILKELIITHQIQ